MGFFSSLWDGIVGVGEMVVDGIAGAGIPVVSGIAEGIGGFIDEEQAKSQHKKDLNWSAAEAQKNRDFQTQERLAAQEWNLDMWNLNNKYNSPVEQLKRAQLAGINPNAIIGQGQNGNVAAQAPRTAPQAGSQASHPGGLASAMLTSDAVVKNLLTQAKKNESEANLNEYELSWNKLTEQDRLQALQLGNKKMGAETKKLLAAAGLDEANTQAVKASLEWYSRQQEADLKIKEEQLNKLRNDSAEVLQRIEESKKRMKKMDSEIAVNKEQAEFIDQKTYESMHDVGLIDEQTRAQEIENDIKSIEKAFSEITNIPVGTPEFQFNYYLWKEGKMLDYYHSVWQKGIESAAKGSGELLGDLGKMFLTKKPAKGMLRKIGQTTKSYKNPSGQRVMETVFDYAE